MLAGFPDQTLQISTAVAVASIESRDLCHLSRDRLVADQRSENLNSFRSAGQVDEEAGLETAGSHHCVVDHVRSIGGADDIDSSARAQAVELGEEHVHDTA
jgi:hypothetical protein